MVTFEVKNIDRLQRKLGKVGTAKALLPSMQEAAYLLQRDLKLYPPIRSESKYRRTDRLKRSWTGTASIRSKRAEGIVGTNVTYAPYVQDTSEQSKVHRRPWRKHTVQYIAKNRRNKIIKDIQADINRLWSGK
jgi:hypothetical protein